MRIKPKTTRNCVKHGEYKIFKTTDKCKQCLKEKQNEPIPRPTPNKRTRRRVEASIWIHIPIEREKTGRKNAITKRSAKKQEEDRKVSAIKADLIEEHGLVCQSTGKHGAVELSHIIPRSLRPDLITNPLNCMIQCHDAHEAWEHKVMDKVAKFKNLGDILKRLKQLDYGRYEKIVSKLREHSI